MYMVSEQFRQRVSEVAGDEGFWKSDAEDTYYEAGLMLIRQGLSEDDAIYYLSELYSAAASCYGD
jgi:hypothetical protein